MKVAHAEPHVLGTGGLQEQQAFKIRTSAHAFKILSSGLYSDKIKAVLREIGCNAYDAHVSVGKADIPIEVKLPNSIDNQFYIKDFGPGLDHDDVMNLYTTYFASTKQTSNDFTGAFGLGSKSPFSYTDSFTVTSRHGGKQRIYSAHIANTGAPNVALMGEADIPKDDTWQTGIMVGFPVNPNDFGTFNHRATEVFRHFKTTPKVVGGTPIKATSYSEDFGEFAIAPELNDGSRSQNDCYALMGNVCYPINKTSLNADGAVAQFINHVNNTLFRFKIGELQVAASREELQYDAGTISAIIKKFKLVATQVTKRLEEVVDSIKTWEDTVKFHKIKEDIQKGLYLSPEIFIMGGCKDGVGLYKVLSEYSREVPKISLPGAQVLIIEPGKKLNSLSIRRSADNLHMDTRIMFKIVYGSDLKPLSRFRRAFSEGVLDGRVLAITRKVEKADNSDIQFALNDIERVFIGVEKIKLSSFPPSTPVSKQKVKKGMLGGLPDDPVWVNGTETKLANVKDKNYVEIEARSSWGRRHVKWIIGENTVEDYQRNKYVTAISVLNKHIPSLGLSMPVEVKPHIVKRAKLTERPEWKLYNHAVEERFNENDVKKDIMEVVKSFRESLNLRYHYGSSVGLVANLRYMYEHHKGMYSTIESVLKEHDIHGLITKISPKNSDMDLSEITNNIKVVESTIGIQIPLASKISVIERVDREFSAAAKISWNEWCTVFKVAPESFPMVVNELLKKG